MVYDRADHLVLSQDGNQRAKSPAKWTVTKYDILGRVLYTGLINSTNSRATMESTYSGSVTPESYTGIGAVAGYTSSNLTPVTVLIVNYYDNYSFLSYSGNNPGSMLTSTTLSGYDNPAATAYAKTLLTGTRVYHLDNPSLFETTALYYDKYSRVVQCRASNQLGGYDITYNALDFRGKVSSTRKEHNISPTVIPEVYTYSYDKAERLTTTNYQLNNNTTIAPFTNYKYDELGRLITNYRHNSTDTVSYLYNIRNWTTFIKSGAFKENLYYNTNLPTGTTACYNGNIAATSWTYNGKSYTYPYIYDQLNRLTDAYGDNCNGNYESFIYDKQGNIKTIYRFNGGQPIDYCTLTYSGNQVINVTDPAGSQCLTSVKEYRNLSTASNKIEFHYDKNGNMTLDSDRNIVAIRYNVLNLPDTIQFGTGNQIINSYAADGRKLGTEYFTRVVDLSVPLVTGQVINQTYTKSAINQNGTAYVDNKEYTTLNGNPALMTLNRILNPEGYVNNYLKDYGAFYIYYRKDHLGNIRETWQAKGFFPSETIQRTQYYPSGLPWASNYLDSPGTQPNKYNGKQFDEMHGYDTYDYGARGYYAAMGRFTTVDPLAEESYETSPYVYCHDNPINKIDPDGRQEAAFELALNANKFRRFYNYLKFTLLGVGVAGTSNAVYNYYVDGDRSKEVFNALTAGVTIQNAKAATPEQRREEKKRQEKSDHENSNIVKKHVKSVKSNIGTPDSGGGSEPKRPLDEMKVAGVVLLGVGIAAELHDDIPKPEHIEPIPVPEVKPIPTKPIETPKVAPLINN